MRKEVENWWKQAKKDLDTAKFNYDGRKYKYASFLCQQAAEKALKALLLKKGHKLIKTHDLVLLARKLGASEDIITLCKELTPVYVETRYPDLGEGRFKEFTIEETKEDIKNTEKIVKWIKKNL